MLRKGQNRARLHPIKETGPAGKRRRINKNKEYIDVQPVRTNPAKQKRMNNKENESKRTRTATTESSRPPRGSPNRAHGEQTDPENYDGPTGWDMQIKTSTRQNYTTTDQNSGSRSRNTARPVLGTADTM